MTSQPSSTFHCGHCGRQIFRASDVIDRVTLWDLRDYRAEAYAVREVTDLEGLRRYDASLHQGWYCCRFIVMRMVEDKFGTGDKLLVYTDSVVEVPEGESPKIALAHPGQVRLTERDYEDVLGAESNRDRILVVKYGAIWCPPCRQMDQAISRIHAKRQLPQVSFFEVDVDEERGLASRWNNRAIPFTLFYFKGRQIRLVGRSASLVDGGFIGGLGEAQLVALVRSVESAARSGQTELSVG